MALQAPTEWQARQGHDWCLPVLHHHAGPRPPRNAARVGRPWPGPAKAKRAAATEQKLVEACRQTFRNFAQRWVDETLFYRSGGCVAQTVRWLDAYVHPAIGDMPLDEVLPRDVLAIIKARAESSVTAERIRVIVQQVYNHAIRKLLVTTNPAQALRGAVARAPVEHHRHLSEKELAGFWRRLDDQGAHVTAISASRLLMLTMTHKSELLRSKWSEFDLDAAQWDIPAERMKMGKNHRVFLSRQAADILRQVREYTCLGQRVFPSIFRGSVPMGDVTLNHFFKRMDFGVSDFSPHGTRGSAAPLLRGHGFALDVVELLLHHGEKNATVAAYSHMELATDRKRALQFLADRIKQLAAGANVAALRAAWVRVRCRSLRPHPDSTRKVETVFHLQALPPGRVGSA